MLMIGDDPTNPPAIRLSAVVNMKGFIERSWRGSLHGNFQIPEPEKEAIKATLLNALIRCVSEKKLRNQYEDLFYKLSALDYPKQWPDLVTNILQRLQSTKPML
jgi:hypothetical protein